MVLVVVLSVLGAALPSAGVVRVYRRAGAEERRRQQIVADRGHADATLDDLTAQWTGVHAPNSRLQVARLDVVLVVLGLVLTAAATILGAAD